MSKLRPFSSPNSPSSRSSRSLPRLACTGAGLALLGACALRAPPPPPAPTAAELAQQRSVQILRTAHGVAHIEAADLEALAYGVAYAHAEDNVCQTADQLLTVRGERSRWFGPEASGLLGPRTLPNAQIDIYIRALMDDGELALAWSRTSADAQAMAAGYVAGYNRFLNDRAASVTGPCAGQPWLRPMTLADYRRLGELMATQAGAVAMADAVLAARLPATGAPGPKAVSASAAAAALAPYRLNDPQGGGNGWAFGADASANGRGLLLANHHTAWRGVDRFWQMHLTVPGQLDVMGAAAGHGAVVQVGFNKDVAWTHTLSTGKRFTLFELKLVPGDTTAYLVSGQPERMRARTVRYDALRPDGQLDSRIHTVWMTRYGPVIAIPGAGLNWTAQTAYALQDANAWNARSTDTWLAINRAGSVAEVEAALKQQGMAGVNTLAADRAGDTLYADASVVPDVDAAQLQRCAPSKPAAALLASAGLVVLDGSRSHCQWRQDLAAAVPGLTPLERLPMLQRRDWVQNANDSFWLSNPALALAGISPLVGPVAVPQRLRTRSGITQIMAALAPQPGQDGVAASRRLEAADLQTLLFQNRNHAAALVLEDLLAACERLPAGGASDGRREACGVLKAWDRQDNAESRGAHLFREWWRLAREVPGVWRQPFSANDPVRTPAGLKMTDTKVRAAVFDALDKAVARVRAAGFALDAPLGDVQQWPTPAGPLGLHGGEEFEGVLNRIEPARPGPLAAGGYQPGFGASYLQTVGFDDRGPVAQGLLTYGQASQADSPQAFDQMALYAQKQWPALPFHPEDVALGTVGAVLRLVLERKPEPPPPPPDPFAPEPASAPASAPVRSGVL